MKKTQDIFISYKAEEFDEADSLRQILEAEGFSCWMAPMSIAGGASYASEIPPAIRNCKIYLLVLSELAQKSKWIPRELDQAINDEKIILPFVIEQCKLEDEFAFYLTNVQRYEAWKNREDALNKMLAEIRAILKPEPDHQDKTSSKEKSKRTKMKQVKNQTASKNSGSQRKSVKKIPFIVGAVIVVLLGIFLFGRTPQTTIAGKEFDSDTSSIYLEDCSISEEDFEIISGMENLNTISFKNCTLPVTAEKLTVPVSLYTLRFEDCGITDSFLKTLDFASMEKLNYLSLNNNTGITDLQLIVDVADTLAELNISDTAVADFNLISKFTNLSSLSADHLGITEIDCLKDLVKLSYVSLKGNAIAALEVFSNCENLTTIDISSNELVNLNGLEKCIYLSKVYASDNALTSIEGLVNTTKLTKVNLSNNQLTDISLLSKSAATLESVYINDNKISDLAPLNAASTLKYLNADNNQLTSLEPLSECISLKELSAADNKITSVNGIQNAETLYFINLADNQILDLTPFQNIEMNYEYGVTLNLNNNKITDLVLPIVTKYRALILTGNKISDYTPLESKKGSYLYVDYSGNTDYTDWANLEFNNIYMMDCPLDQQVTIKEQIGNYKISFIEAADLKTSIEPYTTGTISGQ